MELFAPVSLFVYSIPLNGRFELFYSGALIGFVAEKANLQRFSPEL